MFRNATTYTSFCADSIEWCPHPGHQDVFLTGNYELLGNEQGKIGQVYLSCVEKATPISVDIPESEQCGVTCAATQATYAKDVIDLKSVITEKYRTVQRIPHKPTFRTLDRITTPAVLDLKWNMHPLHSHTPLSYFVGAYEDGSLRLYTFNPTHEKPIHQECSLQVGRNALCLSADWSNRRQYMYPSEFSPATYIASCKDSEDLTPKMDDYEENFLPSNTFIATSLSDGSAAIADVHSTTEHPLSLSIRHHWQAHEAMEAWITGVDYWEPTRVFTGSDDQLLKTWDTRMIDVIHPDYYGHCSYDAPYYGRATDDAEDVIAAKFAQKPENCREYDPDFVPSSAFPVAVSRAHQQGVCSIHCHPYNPYLLATGSYDDNLYIWDKRNMRTPIAQHHMGGGVWRVKWHPNPKFADTLLVVNMYNGVHVVKIDGIASAVNSISDNIVYDILTGDSTWPSWSTSPSASGSDSSAQTHSAFTSSQPTLYASIRDLPEDEAVKVCESAQESAMARASLAWCKYGEDGLGEVAPRVIASYYEHGSKTIAYGGDWCCLDKLSEVYDAKEDEQQKVGAALIATCSFYNKRVDLVRVGGEEDKE